MKKLQNDYTTPEQSKQLLELGVPADSANYAYMCYEIGDMCRVFINEPYTIYSENVKRLLGRKTLPCWSVGRLLEIIKICSSHELAIAIYGRAILYLDIIDGIICEMAHEIGSIDFSKLEE